MSNREAVEMVQKLGRKGKLPQTVTALIAMYLNLVHPVAALVKQLSFSYLFDWRHDPDQEERLLLVVGFKRWGQGYFRIPRPATLRNRDVRQNRMHFGGFSVSDGFFDFP